ncbi:peptidase M66, partial [Escherichia coli]|nr:peptidase M66 [Escherichia coli]
LVIKQGNLSGRLNDIKIGAPGELLLHTIDIGMLTTPRDRFDFAKDKEAHREYFQTIPVSRMIVNNYAPLHLKEVMLPTGELLTDMDPGNGGWHSGTMRQRIGKELVSHGIDNANYGLNSTAGLGENSHPYVVAQLAAHNSRGNYANGIQVHGGSGGGGIVTLDSTLGNEFSHEVGHNYGLGHYVDGFKGSVHRSAENNNSTWGWDGDKKRFIPNFYPS